MGKKRNKAISLLNRFQFIDLAEAVAEPAKSRKDWLKMYLDRAIKPGAWPSYRPFRNAIPTIYGAIRGLDPSPRVGRSDLESVVSISCKGKDVEMNVEAALCLYDLVHPEGYLAYDHPPQDLALGLQRKAAIGLKLYLVDGDNLLFQFPYPRRKRLNDRTMNLLMSMIHHSYAIGDYSDATVSIADLSSDTYMVPLKEGVPKSRNSRIIKQQKDQLISMDQMSDDIQSVHDLLLELGEEAI